MEQVLLWSKGEVGPGLKEAVLFRTVIALERCVINIF